MAISRKARCELCWIIAFMAAVPMLYFLVAGQSGYLQLREHRSKLRQVRQANTELWQENSDLGNRVEELLNDPEAMKRIAREQNGMARPGDIIINLPASPKEKKSGEQLSAPTLD